jgi:predicted nucleotidyltransferase
LDRDAAMARSKARDTELRQPAVEPLYLLASATHEDASNDSNVDLFFDYEGGKFGPFDLMDVRARPSGILGRRAGIIPRDSRHKKLRLQIEAAAAGMFR